MRVFKEGKFFVDPMHSIVLADTPISSLHASCDVTQQILEGINKGSLLVFSKSVERVQRNHKHQKKGKFFKCINKSFKKV